MIAERDGTWQWADDTLGVHGVLTNPRGSDRMTSHPEFGGAVMGLDVGVATIRYLPRPSGAAYRFAWHLLENYCEVDWQFGEGTDMLAQYDEETLEHLAEAFAKSEGLRPDERSEVLAWVRHLPWQEGRLYLHLTF